jgi:hypothetical protein
MNNLDYNTKSLDLNKIITEAFEIFKKTSVFGALLMAVISVVIMIFVIIGVSFFMSSSDLSPEELKKFQPEMLSLNGKLIYYSILVLYTSLLAPISAGLLKISQLADEKKDIQFSDLFVYVNSKYFAQIVVSMAIITIINLCIPELFNLFLPLMASKIIGMLVSVVIGIFTFLMIPFIVFDDLNFKEAITKSFSTISKNLLITIVVIIIGGIGAIIGVIACCVGIFFTISFLQAVQFSLYKNIKESSLT